MQFAMQCLLFAFAGVGEGRAGDAQLTQELRLSDERARRHGDQVESRTIVAVQTSLARSECDAEHQRAVGGEREFHDGRMGQLRRRG